jgi:hypothetical protein
MIMFIKNIILEYLNLNENETINDPKFIKLYDKILYHYSN